MSEGVKGMKFSEERSSEIVEVVHVAPLTLKDLRQEMSEGSGFVSAVAVSAVQTKSCVHFHVSRMSS